MGINTTVEYKFMEERKLGMSPMYAKLSDGIKGILRFLGSITQPCYPNLSLNLTLALTLTERT